MTIITTNALVSDQLSSRRGIVQLREWGTVRAHPLPPQGLRCRLGTEDGCAVLLSDPDVLPVHAQLTRDHQRWLIRALGDEPGLQRDGARTHAFCLEPGLEVGRRADDLGRRGRAMDGAARLLRPHARVG